MFSQLAGAAIELRTKGKCFTHTRADLVATPQRARLRQQVVPLPGPHKVTIAIETDQELRDKFATHQEALDYLGAQASSLVHVFANTDAQVQVTDVRLWETTDPWASPTPGGQLDELLTYWQAPEHRFAVADMVLFISGKPVQGGIAYVDALCTNYAFAVAQVTGDLNDLWDTLVTGHEVGHVLGSPHTHCYDPPIDKCYNRESGCYAGEVVPQDGTLMSYCHLLPGHIVTLELGPRVHDRIGERIAADECLAVIGTTTTTATSSTTSTTMLLLSSRCTNAIANATLVCAQRPNSDRCRRAQARARAHCHTDVTQSTN